MCCPYGLHGPRGRCAAIPYPHFRSWKARSRCKCRNFGLPVSSQNGWQIYPLPSCRCGRTLRRSGYSDCPLPYSSCLCALAPRIAQAASRGWTMCLPNRKMTSVLLLPLERGNVHTCWVANFQDIAFGGILPRGSFPGTIKNSYRARIHH